MLPPDVRRKADFVVSILFMLFGALIIWRASQMPWVSTRTGGDSQWFLSPGLFPAVVGSLLILFSARVLLTAIRDGGHRNVVRPFLAWIRALPRNVRVHRVVFMVAWIGLYVFFGVGHFPFEVVSAIFIFVFILYFWLPGAGGHTVRRTLIAAAVAVVFPTVVAYVFETYLYVPSP